MMRAIAIRVNLKSWIQFATLVLFANCCITHAATQYGTGSFNWDDGSTAAWAPSSGGLYDLVWTNGNDAVFEGVSGTVDIVPAGVTARNLTFDTAGFNIRSNTLTLTGTPLITANADAMISAAIAATAGLTKAGNADLILPGTNVYAGATAVNAGTLQIGDGTANPALNADTYTIADGATLKLFTDGVWDISGQQAFFANIRGAGILRLDSTAKVDWPGSGSQYYANFDSGFTGSLVIDRGRMPSQTGGLGGITSVTINDGGQIGTWNGGTFPQNFAIAGYYGDEINYNVSMRTSNPGRTSTFSGTIEISASTEIQAQGTTYLQGVISGAADADLTCSARDTPGLLIMSGENTYEGSTIINKGLTLQIGGGGTTGSLNPESAITTDASLKFNRSDNITQETEFGIISGTGDIIQGGSGTVTLTAGNSYSGATIVNAGTLKLGAPPAFRYYRFHVTANNGDGYNQFSEMHFYSNGVWTAATDGSPATTLNNGENHWSQCNDNNKDTKFGQNGLPYTLTYDFGTPHHFDSYNWSSANDRTPNRNPTRWMVYGSNDNSTWATISDMSEWGMLGPTTTFTWAGVDPDQYTAIDGSPDGGASNAYPMQSQTLPLNTPVKITSGAVLDLNGNNAVIGSLSGNEGVVTNSNGSPTTLTINQVSGEEFFNGSITDGGSGSAVSVVKSGLGTAALTGENTYNGSTIIKEGTLKLAEVIGYRFFKFEVSSVYGGGNNGLQYSEMAFYSSGTNNVNSTRVFPVTATGDGGQYGDQGIPGLYDNNINTKSFMGTPFPRFVTFDFGSPQIFSGYCWATANDMTPTRNPNDWTVQGSNDGSTWTVIDTQTGAGATPTTLRTYASGWPLTDYAAQPGRLPVTTSVQVDSSATLDLGGSTQTIATLSGSGLVTSGTLTASDSIMPGGEDTIDTLSLNGVTISGTLLIDVNTDGSCDTLAAQGDLDLSGLSLTVANPDQLNPQQTYTVITCSGTRTGKFTSLSGADGWYIQYMPDGSVNLAFSGGTLILVR